MRTSFPIRSLIGLFGWFIGQKTHLIQWVKLLTVALVVSPRQDDETKLLETFSEKIRSVQRTGYVLDSNAEHTVDKGCALPLTCTALPLYL